MPLRLEESLDGRKLARLLSQVTVCYLVGERGLVDRERLRVRVESRLHSERQRRQRCTVSERQVVEHGTPRSPSRPVRTSSRVFERGAVVKLSHSQPASSPTT